MKPGWAWRAMTPQDVLPVCAMEAQACMHPLHAWTEANYRSSLNTGYWCRALIDHEGLPAGVCVCLFGVGELHLLNIAVSDRWHRQGLARWMLDRIRDEAMAQGMDAVWLEVRPSNARARALYRSEGYEEISVRKNYYPAVDGREDAVVMRLAIPQAGAA